jgi:tetratricopeptide (TPR) repeat protein
MDKAIRYAREAGDRATEAAAFEAAVELYRSALDVLERFGPEDPILRCELLLAIGMGYDMIGDHASRDRWSVDAAEAARSTGRADLFAHAALGYGGAWLPAAIQPDPKAEALLKEALQRLGQGVWPLRARVTARLAHWMQNARPYEERRLLADEALALARRGDDRGTLASVIFDRCWALDGPDDVDEELALADEVLQFADDVGVLELWVQGMRIRLGALAERGDYEDARRAGREFARLAHELRHPEALRLVNLWEVVQAATEGRFEDAERLSAEQFARLQEMKHPQALLVLTGQTFAWRWMQGRAGEYLPIFAGLHQSDPSNLTWSASLAWITAETEDLERTQTILGELTPAAVARIDRNYLWFGTIAGFAQAAAAVGDRDWAAALAERAFPYATRSCTLGLLSFNGAMAYHLGVLLDVLGRWDEAVSQLDAALERHETMGARPFTAFTQQAQATTLRHRGRPGDRERADELEKAALVTSAELGLQALERRSA